MAQPHLLRDGDASRSIDLEARRHRVGESIVKLLFATCALLSVVVTVGIVLSLLGPTIEFFQKVSFRDFVTEDTWAPLFRNAQFGVRPLVQATLLITGIALLVAIPLGLMAAIYLAEYAPSRVRSFLKPTLELLAGIPTVVYGFFALFFVTPLLKDIWPFGELGTFNALSAGLVMGVMIIPTIASLAEDAMSAVPDSLRQGALALGGSKGSTTVRVVVPAALSGIIAAIVLGVSRAIGETMIVAIAAGGTPRASWNPAEGMQTMTGFIAAAGIGDQPTGSTGYQTIFAVGATLFVFTLLVNAVSIRLVRRYREVYE